MQTNSEYNTESVRSNLTLKLSRCFNISPDEADENQLFSATVLTIRDILASKRKSYMKRVRSEQRKRVYYLCMEFLVGRSLKMNLLNLGLEDTYREVLSSLGCNLDKIYEYEDDPGLGNGGLGRLAACYMDALTTGGYPTTGFSLCYEYGLFRQHIVNGEQVELPDIWLPSGENWIIQRQDKATRVRFGGKIEEKWSDGRLEIIHTDYDEVEAVPFDMMISGADTENVSTLRLWKARNISNFDMKLFSQGEYIKAVDDRTAAETISRVLYPDDRHPEGKLLRLTQQYFLVSASLQTIIADHLNTYHTLDSLAEKAAIHINDTHPALAIPELMRLLVDCNGYSWDAAWEITVNAISYTNHTVLPEALECWNEELFRIKLPRIHRIIREINERFCAEAWKKFTGNWDKVGRMSVFNHGQVRMANLCVIGSHCINGVSRLHSDILQNSVFADFFDLYPERFTNVTNGISHRRWLCASNPGLAELLDGLIGTGYRLDAGELSKLAEYASDTSVTDALASVKHRNKVAFSDYYSARSGIRLDPDSIFDVQIKRLHEYKRQLLNVLNIISLYVKYKEDPSASYVPRTFIFGAKAAPGYYQAKEIIRLICSISEEIERDPSMREKLRVVFLENYNVTLAERLIPAADVSEQISLAGKEASGTGNMKLMMNGALTVGTLDGANIEIKEAVGDGNIFIFGMNSTEVRDLWQAGYRSSDYYRRSETLRVVMDRLGRGFAGRDFSGMADYLLFAQGVADPYMCLADFDEYTAIQKKISAAYTDGSWNRMSLYNIAGSGRFAADRSVGEYARNIWHLEPLK